MLKQIDWDYGGDNDAKAGIAAAVRYLLRDATGSPRDDIVREIIEHVDAVANGSQDNPPDARATRPVPVSGIIYRAYIIDTFRRDTDRWRATIRRSDGKKIRVAIPPAVLDQATTSADALTAEKAVEFAKKAIDGGGLT